jgi:hypothetical protein
MPAIFGQRQGTDFAFANISSPCGSTLFPCFGGACYAGAWLAPRERIAKFASRFRPSELSEANLEASSFTFIQNDTWQTRNLLDFSVGHLSYGVAHIPPDELKERAQMLRNMSRKKPSAICDMDREALALVPVNVASVRDAPREIGSLQRQWMVTATISVLLACFAKVVCAVPAAPNPTQQFLLEMFPSGLLEFIPLQPVSKQSMPLQAIASLATRLSEGEWPSARYVYFTEDDQVLHKRLSAKAMFTSVQRIPAASSGVIGTARMSSGVAGGMDAILITPHRLHLASPAAASCLRDEGTIGALCVPDEFPVNLERDADVYVAQIMPRIMGLAPSHLGHDQEQRKPVLEQREPSPLSLRRQYWSQWEARWDTAFSQHSTALANKSAFSSSVTVYNFTYYISIGNSGLKSELTGLAYPVEPREASRSTFCAIRNSAQHSSEADGRAMRVHFLLQAVMTPASQAPFDEFMKEYTLHSAGESTLDRTGESTTTALDRADSSAAAETNVKLFIAWCRIWHLPAGVARVAAFASALRDGKRKDVVQALHGIQGRCG